MAYVKNNLPKILISVVIIVAVIISITFMEIGGRFGVKNDSTFVINNNDNLYKIAGKLKEQNIINSALLFRAYSKFSKKDLSQIHPGTAAITKKSSYNKILESILNSNRDDGRVLIPEGFNLSQIADKLEQAGLINKDKFYEAAMNYDFKYNFLNNIPKTKNRLEGFLFPDTYIFSKTADNEVTIIDKMLKRFDQMYDKKLKDDAKKLNMNTFEIVTLASIIQREALTESDFYLVSAVFHNRLKRTDNLKYLQSCATVQYILGEQKAVLSVADTKIDSPYNTYKYPHLPAGPISSPGKVALDAAINPANEDYLYFLNDANGKLHFSKTFEEHQKLMKQFGL